MLIKYCEISVNEAILYENNHKAAIDLALVHEGLDKQ